MKNIPTVEEFLPKNSNGMYSRNEVEKAMIEFAKLHVESALKEASERYEYDETHISDDPTFLKDSILKSYPLDQIK